MLIIGAKGLAKELLEIYHKNEYSRDIYFYDDINLEIGDYLFDQFRILKNEKSVKDVLGENFNFIIGIGNPFLRKKMYEKFITLGGNMVSLISSNADVGSFDNHIEEGVTVTSGCIITNSVKIGKGTLINLGCTIGHDTVIKDFVEVCPNVSISGRCHIGENVFIGTGSVILPGIEIGDNSVIAAGSSEYIGCWCTSCI
ncbi:acetyltransferase [Riemerella columbina]|uniref:acetyltransferase n=1 Tax=Riemerella columbina TaxID=103810 RepID=UPI0003A477F4|nr:acetyltransferase [Riemerella columbina]